MNTKTNLSQHPCENKCSKFSEGDFVVFTNDIRNDDVHQIDAFQPSEYYWLTTGEIVHKDNIRLATDLEIQTKQRTPVDVLKHFKRAQKSQKEVS